MGLIQIVVMVALAGVLSGAVPAAASVAPELGDGAKIGREILGPDGPSNPDAIVDCRAMQCGFFAERSASRAVATAAGAKPLSTSYAPAMVPELTTGPRGSGSVSGLQTPDGSALGASLGGPPVDPAVFALLESSDDPRFCIEGGHLPSIRPSCKAPHAKPCDLFSTDGQSAPCGTAVPEPGTLLLFGMGLLGFVAARGRRTR